MKLNDRQLRWLAATSHGPQLPGKSHMTVKSLERLGLVSSRPVILNGCHHREYSITEEGRKLICTSCNGIGGLDSWRPQTRDCQDCNGIGAHQP